MPDKEESSTIVIRRAKSVTLDLDEYYKIVDQGNRLSRFARLVYENKNGLIEDFYSANRLEEVLGN